MYTLYQPYKVLLKSPVEKKTISYDWIFLLNPIEISFVYFFHSKFYLHCFVKKTSPSFICENTSDSHNKLKESKIKFNSHMQSICSINMFWIDILLNKYTYVREM